MKQKLETIKIAIVVLAIVVLTTLLVSAGNLEPSAPLGPTMKTLDEVEPRIPIQSLSGSAGGVYVIDQPGSYYLTGNINITETDKIGILVDSSNVTIDLMGFTINGPGSVTGDPYYTGHGIANGSCPGDDRCDNIEIRNGTISNFGSCGIRDLYCCDTGYRIINIRAASNGGVGISLDGEGHLVKDCRVFENGAGIRAYSGSIITGNVVYSNQGNGIDGSDVLVTGNMLFQNNGDGIYATGSCVITGNNIRGSNNADYGIYTETRSTVTGNTVEMMGANYGIYTLDECIVTDNTVYGKLAGIQVSSNCKVSNNRAESYAGYGIHTGDNCTASNNTASSGNDAIHTGSNCKVSDNQADSTTTGHGIFTSDSCKVSNNQADSSTDYGIYTGSSCTLTGNNVSGSHSGIYTTNGCTVTDNTASYNQNWGFYLGSGCTVTNNTAYENNQSNTSGYGGIRLYNGNIVKGNTTRSNDQNNIRVTGSDNIIEENLVTLSSNGINFIVSGNFYANNRARNNGTDYANGASQTDGGGNWSF